MKEILRQQFKRAKLNGWIPFFESAAEQFGFSTADLMAVASRESNMRNIKGDFHSGEYHGFSLMQLDINSHREWIESEAWQDVEEAISKGAEALAEKRDQIIRTSKMPIARVRFRSGKTAVFTPRPLNPQELRHCYLAAYNCGGASYYHFSIGNDIDRGTAHGNYGRDVIERAFHFAEFLGSAGQVESPAEVLADTVVDESGPADIPPTETSQDLFDVAAGSSKLKALWPKVWKSVVGFLPLVAAFYESHKGIGILVVLLAGFGLAWIASQNWKWIKPRLMKVLK